MADSSNNSGTVNPFEVARQKAAKAGGKTAPAVSTPAAPAANTPKIDPTNPFEVARQKAAKLAPVAPVKVTKPAAPKSEIDSFFSQKNLELVTPENVNKKVAEANAIIQGSPVYGPTVSAMSFILNGLQVGNAAMAGGDYKRVQDNQKGIITPADITKAALNGDTINGKKVKSKIVNGQPVWNVKATVTDPAKIAEIETARINASVNNATAFVKPNKKTIYGADLEMLKNPGISEGEAALKGLGYDLTHDPFILVNPLKPLQLLKPLIGAAKTFSTTAKTGDVSLNLIKDAVKNSDLLPELATKLPEDKIKLSDLATKTPTIIEVNKTGIRKNLQGRGGKAAEVQAKAEKKLANAEIKTVSLTPDEMALLKAKTGIVNPVLATALEAAKKAYTQITVSQKATKFLEGYVKREVSGIRKVTPTAVIYPDFAGNGGFKVLGGNGEELATAATRKGAQEAVSAIKKGAAPQGEIVPVEVAPKAPDVPVMTTKQAIELTTQDGAPLSLTKNVVHEATDGASYVFDGEDVRKFATTLDAQNFVQNSAKGLVKEATILQEGKKWNVRQGDSVTTYATKAEATAAAKKINTGQITPARITTGAAPAVKAAEPTVSIADLAKIRPSDAVGKAAQATLKNVEKAVSEISGTQVGIRSVDRATLREMVESKNLMNQLRVLASSTAKTAAESIRLASRLDGYNPIVMREALISGTTEGKKALLRLIDATPIMTEAGEKTTLGALLNVKKWDASMYPAGTLKNMLDALDSIYQQIMKAGKMSASGAKYAQIEKTFGKEVADKVKATGILESGADQAAMNKYLALEKNLEAASKVTKYGSFEDVIKGLASGDSISSPDLAKVITALDPSKKILKQVDAAVDKNDAEFLKNIISGEGVQSMNDVQKKIVYTADFSNMLKVEGIGYDDVLSSAFASADAFKGPALTPNPNSAISEDFIRMAEMEESPEALAQLLKNEVTGAGDIATEALNTAFSKLGANLDDIAEVRGSLDTISLYGDVTSRVSKKAWTGRAALPEQLNQVADGYIASSINGIARDRFVKAKKDLGAIEDYLFEQTIKEFDKVSAALGLLGLRLQRNKIVTALTKKMAEPKHLVYLHTGDIFKAFDATGGRQIIKDTFYSGGKDFERDSFLHQNLGEGARYVLEQDAAGATIDMAKLTELVQSGVATPSLKPTAAFEAKIPELAQRLAAQLANPATIKAMKEAHLTKSIGLASRAINQTHSVAQDIFATVYDAIRLNALNGNLSAADMTALMRGHLSKLATAGNFFNLSSGPVASAAFRSWSQIIALRGKVAGADVLDKQEWVNFRTAMNNFADVEKTMPADVEVLVPKHTVLNKKQMADFLKKENINIEKAQAEINLAKRDNVAAQVIEDLDAGNFEKFDVPEEDMPDFVMQAMFDRSIKEQTTWGVDVINPQLEEKIMPIKTKYAKDPKGRFKALDKNDWYLLSGREDFAAAMIEMETKTYREEHEFVELAMMAESKLKDLPEADFNRAFSLLRDGVILTDDVIGQNSEAVLNAREVIKPVYDLLFGSKANNGFKEAGIRGAWLQRELEQVGLGITRGFTSMKDYAAEDLYAMARELPFGERPASITGTGAIADWERRAAEFQKSGLTPLFALTKIAQAAGSVRHQVGMARDIYSRFSHVAEKLSPAQANRKGYVKITSAEGANIAIDAIPEGALFPPNIAKQYGQTIRDYDYARNATANQVVRTIMQLTGVTKALWTVINPGHHLNTFTGTMNQLILKGVVNSKRYEVGFRMSGRNFADAKLTSWDSRKKMIDDADAWAAQVRKAFDAATFDTSSFEQVVAARKGKQPKPYELTFIENGKAVNYSEDYIQQRFKDAGLLEDPIQQQDITNLQDNLLPDLNSVKEAELVKKLKGKHRMTKIKSFEESITRKPALLGAVHGNALRVAEALDVMQKRSWKSLDEAIEAAIKEVAVSQPTSKSLTAFERKWGRMGTSFYTWARMNQVVMLRMFAQNAREINIAQDLLYNINTFIGYNPQNTGSAYPNNAAVPSYMSAKSGGVIVPVNGVPVLTQPSLPYNEGGNFWGLQVDLSKPLEENIIGISNGRPVGLVWQVASIPAKNMSIAANLAQKIITQRNPQTGQGLDVNNGWDAYREFVQPLLGRPGQLGAAATNVMETPDKSILAVINWLTGARATNLIDPGVGKVAKIEQGQRQNEFLKRLGLK